MTTFLDDISGKKVLVFGLGRQGGGVGDSEWLKSHGAIVKLSDRDTTLVSEGQTKEQIDWAEIIIKNPAVADNHELILYAKSKSIPVYTSIALFVKYTSVKTIGITGTRGKSTTTALITKMLERLYPDQVISGGNIAGTSCLSLFDQSAGKRYAVLELSSFQLHNFHELEVSPSIAIITNLYPDHLNRYPSMAEYQRDKEAICQYQKESDICLYNEGNVGAVSMSGAGPSIKIPFSVNDVSDWVTNLPGAHNRENIAAMAALTKALGLDDTIAREVARDFPGLPFRQEFIATVQGVRYVNDTTATTPIAAVKALQAATAPTIWITGGATKNLPYDELLDEVKINGYIKKIVILGSKDIPDYTDKLASIAGDKIVGFALSMTEAIDMSRGVAEPGDTVLLSPGFTSFDLFQNEFDRGRKFNECVKALKS